MDKWTGIPFHKVSTTGDSMVGQRGDIVLGQIELAGRAGKEIRPAGLACEARGEYVCLGCPDDQVVVAVAVNVKMGRGRQGAELLQRIAAVHTHVRVGQQQLRRRKSGNPLGDRPEQVKVAAVVPPHHLTQGGGDQVAGFADGQVQPAVAVEIAGRCAQWSVNRNRRSEVFARLPPQREVATEGRAHSPAKHSVGFAKDGCTEKQFEAG